LNINILIVTTASGIISIKTKIIMQVSNRFNVLRHFG